MSKVMDKGKISKTQECIPVGCVPSAAVDKGKVFTLTLLDFK